MKFRDPASPMWLQALKMLEQADQLHRRFFQLGKPASRGPVWEPPIDILETDRYLLIQIALPGVDLSDITVVIENNIIHVVGERQIAMGADTVIRRLEYPLWPFRKTDQPAKRTLSDIRKFSGKWMSAFGTEQIMTGEL